MPSRERVDWREPVEESSTNPAITSRTRASPALVLGCVADDRVTDGLAGLEAVFLIEHADGRAAAHRHLAAVGRATTGQHHEQRHFTVTVATDDADPVALADAEGDRVEHDFGGDFEVQSLGSEQMCHSPLGW